jgi:hypothetical protein
VFRLHPKGSNEIQVLLEYTNFGGFAAMVVCVWFFPLTTHCFFVCFFGGSWNVVSGKLDQMGDDENGWQAGGYRVMAANIGLNGLDALFPFVGPIDLPAFVAVCFVFGTYTRT